MPSYAFLWAELELPSAITTLALFPMANPTKLSFTASLDHSTTIFDGSPTVTDYRLDIYSGATVVSTTQLGKPTPDAANTITVSLPSLSGNGPFIAKVVTVGPGGESTAAGAPFGFAPVPAAVTAVRVF